MRGVETGRAQSIGEGGAVLLAACAQALVALPWLPYFVDKCEVASDRFMSLISQQRVQYGKVSFQYLLQCLCLCARTIKVKSYAYLSTRGG